MTLSPFLLTSKSRGTLRLKSANPFDYPLIDPHYLEHPDDVIHMLEGMIFNFAAFFDYFYNYPFLMLYEQMLCQEQT